MSNIAYVLLSALLLLTSCSMPGGTEWIWIVIAILIFFGGRKIPELMRGVGKGIRELNDAKDGIKKEFDEGLNEKDSQSSRKAKKKKKTKDDDSDED